MRGILDETTGHAGSRCKRRLVKVVLDWLFQSRVAQSPPPESVVRSCNLTVSTSVLEYCCD